ncbi:MAG: hypothetical protein AAF228_06745 [Pseudomonadota bacterium]
MTVSKAVNDRLEGGDGDDILYNSLGNDELIGDAGDDTIKLGKLLKFGVIDGGVGDDTLDATELQKAESFYVLMNYTGLTPFNIDRVEGNTIYLKENVTGREGISFSGIEKIEVSAEVAAEARDVLPEPYVVNDNADAAIDARDYSDWFDVSNLEISDQINLITGLALSVDQQRLIYSDNDGKFLYDVEGSELKSFEFQFGNGNTLTINNPGQFRISPEAAVQLMNDHEFFELAPMINHSENKIYGDDNDNTPLNGTDNNDLIAGLGGNDTLFGFDGNDTLVGGNGNDTLFSGEGYNQLIGGNGDDTLISSERGVLNELYGGAGDDTFEFDALSDLSIIDGGEGIDTLVADNLNIRENDAENFYELMQHIGFTPFNIDYVDTIENIIHLKSDVTGRGGIGFTGIERIKVSHAVAVEAENVLPDPIVVQDTASNTVLNENGNNDWVDFSNLTGRNQDAFIDALGKIIQNQQPDAPIYDGIDAHIYDDNDGKYAYDIEALNLTTFEVPFDNGNTLTINNPAQFRISGEMAERLMNEFGLNVV